MNVYKNLGEKISTEAFAAFDKFCRLYSKADDMSDQADEYGKWCDAGNRIELSDAEIELYRRTGSTAT